MLPRQQAQLDTILHSEIKNLTFKGKDYLKLIKNNFEKMTEEQLNSERQIATNLSIALDKSLGLISPSEWRKYSLDFNLNILKAVLRSINPTFSKIDADELRQIRAETYKLFTLKRAESRFKRANQRKPLVYLSPSEVIQALRSNKNAKIIYDSGHYVLAPRASYGGYASGLIDRAVMDQLQRNNAIEQGVYFNADGRKIYQLPETAKKSQNVPAWLRSLDRSYLRACGIKN